MPGADSGRFFPYVLGMQRAQRPGISRRLSPCPGSPASHSFDSLSRDGFQSRSDNSQGVNRATQSSDADRGADVVIAELVNQHTGCFSRAHGAAGQRFKLPLRFSAGVLRPVTGRVGIVPIPMTDGLLSTPDQEEALSRVYALAVAARTGYVAADCDSDRDGVDLRIQAGGSMRPAIEFQLKATVNLPAPQAGYVKFPFETAKLRSPDR